MFIKAKLSFTAKARKTVRNLLTAHFWLSLQEKIKSGFSRAVRETGMFLAFFVVVLIFLVEKLLGLVRFILEKIPFGRKLLRKMEAIWRKKAAFWCKRFFDSVNRPPLKSQVKPSYLVSLAFQNMAMKKTRSLVTVGGMAVGIGAIVFLVSLGYGAEKLVISQVARLNDLRMADVSPGESAALRLNQKAIEKIKAIKNVEDVVPSVSVVGKARFQEAVADILVYAVPQKYFDYNGIAVIKGKVYQSNEISFLKKVAGVKTELKEGKEGEKIGEVGFNIFPDKAVLVWEKPSLDASVLGYSRRILGGYKGEEYWGEAYYSLSGKGREAYDRDRGVFLGKWLKARVPLYQKNEKGELVPLLDDLGRARWQEGWLMEKNVYLTPLLSFSGRVLGEASESGEQATNSANLDNSDDAPATVSASLFRVVAEASDSSGIEWVEIDAATEEAKKKEQVIDFEEPPVQEAVVSTAMLKLFNFSSPQEAIGKEFKISFVIVKTLMPELEGKITTKEIGYKIIGVVDDDNSAYLFVPLIDLLRAGVSNYSQVRVVAASKNSLAQVRKEIETLGFRTSSTVDTVARIEKLFSNLRLLLGLLGTVALLVAILGMFNTLTVSLLERMREIGGMKAMGMLSIEVRNLLLAEAMIISLSGGILGILFGFLAGKGLSLLVSIFSLIKGQGYLDLTFIPPFFIFFIILTSFVVGVLTGLYPSRRAAKISALNALRYE
ncbi:ABC transporter permease [Candidatus Aerophobetes bacterium]|nr:ABC transporter permease [Candidatus Aerophobetes bacterium]